MNFNAVTIRDIAKELNLSVSTVSKALRDSYEISDKTKKIVINCAQKHNYRPNTIAQSLKQGISKSIGIVVSAIDNQFFSQVISGIESVAYEAGLMLSSPKHTSRLTWKLRTLATSPIVPSTGY
jgi:LacI family transcriptional regulator